jgi:type I restriction enzyme S subunit
MSQQRTAPLGECARFLSGGTPSKARADFWAGDIPWVSSGEMGDTWIDDTSLHVTEDGVEAGSRLVPRGTILAVVRGMSLATEFRISMTARPMAFNQDLKAIVASEEFDPVYLFYSLFVQRDYIKDKATEASHGTKKLDTDVLAAVPVVVRSVTDQKAIAARAAAFDSLIANNRRRIALLDQAARLIYEEWFVRLRFPGHEGVRVVDGVPEGWERVRLDTIADVNAETLPASFDGEIQYVDIASVSPGQIDGASTLDFRDAPSRARRPVRPGDILWSCVRPNRRSHALAWAPPANMVASTGFAVIRATQVPATFLYQAVTTDGFVGYLENHARGAAYPAVVAADFERAEVLLPPEKIVQAYDKVAGPMAAQREGLMAQSEKLSVARDLLLPRLMSGEVIA